MIAVGVEKGYSTTLRSVVGEGYTRGEVIHKMKRYEMKRDDTDLVKAAGHTFLLYFDRERNHD